MDHYRVLCMAILQHTWSTTCISTFHNKAESMNSKSAIYVSLRLVVQLLLFGMFLYLFGEPAVRRYLDKKVMVVTSRRESGGSPAQSCKMWRRKNYTEQNVTSGRARTMRHVWNWHKSYILEQMLNILSYEVWTQKFALVIIIYTKKLLYMV